MIIPDLIMQAETAIHPTAKAVFKGNGFKVLALAFKKGMVLKDHKTLQITKLVVVKGAVIFKLPEKEIQLNVLDDYDIPVNELHAVIAIADSAILLIQT